MSKKKMIAEIYMEGKEALGIRVNQKRMKMLPYATTVLVAALINISRDSGMKDYAINNLLKVILAEAWSDNGGCKDIVEEIE